MSDINDFIEVVGKKRIVLLIYGLDKILEKEENKREFEQLVKTLYLKTNLMLIFVTNKELKNKYDGDYANSDAITTIEVMPLNSE